MLKKQDAFRVLARGSVWPGAEDSNLSHDELAMLKYVTNASPILFEYICRIENSAYFALFIYLAFKLDGEEYKTAAKAIADKLPGVDVYFGIDYDSMDYGILVCVPKDLTSEIPEIKVLLLNILGQYISREDIRQPKDYRPQSLSSLLDSPASCISKEPPKGTTVYSGYILNSYWMLKEGGFTHIIEIQSTAEPDLVYLFGGMDLMGKNCYSWIMGLTAIFGINKYGEKKMSDGSFHHSVVRYAVDKENICVAISSGEGNSWLTVPPA